MIDHTLINPDSTKKDVIALCEEARRYGFGGVAINPFYVSLAAKLLRNTSVKVISALGFPFGATLTEVKVFEARKVMENGAHEIDMMINVGALRSKDYLAVRKDIEAVVNTAHSYGNVLVKVIIETGFLTDEEKVYACEIAKEAHADFVKTSTGLYTGATVEDVKLIRKTVGKIMGVKASGGIRNLKDMLVMIKAGANRIGTSTGVAILNEVGNE